MPEDKERKAPQDGPDAGSSSQGEPGAADESEERGDRHRHHPGAPSDTNERADASVSVVEPDGKPVETDDGEEN